MLAIPAVDLKDGRVVRLLRGDFREEKVYDDVPESVARGFESEGAGRLHVVDLDGALKGEPGNFDGVEKILRSVKVPVQVGGGIREVKTAARYFSLGVRWVILGTKACLDRGFLNEAVREFGEKVIIGIDARDGQVATDGWTRLMPVQALDMAKEAASRGVRTVIYTDISKDGTMRGPNISEIQKLSQAVAMDWISSGGVGSLDHLKALRDLKQENIIGAVIGKALYEKKFTLKEAVAACS